MLVLLIIRFLVLEITGAAREEIEGTRTITESARFRRADPAY